MNDLSRHRNNRVQRLSRLQFNLQGPGRRIPLEPIARSRARATEEDSRGRREVAEKEALRPEVAFG